VGQAYTAQADYESAIAIWQQLYYWQELYRIGRVAQGNDQPDIALRAFIASWEINPKFATNHLASLLIEKGELEDAENVYRRAIRMISRYDHRQPSWHQGLARLLMEQDRWSEAVEAWEDVLHTAYLHEKINNQLDQVYYEMAWAYHMSGQNQKAVEAIEQAVAQNPTLRSLLRAGQIYEAIGDRQKAVNAYRQVIDTDPNHQTAQEGIDRLENSQ
jgi:tetratricopeptide (TPR) repeat protein